MYVLGYNLLTQLLCAEEDLQPLWVASERTQASQPICHRLPETLSAFLSKVCFKEPHNSAQTTFKQEDAPSHRNFIFTEC